MSSESTHLFAAAVTQWSLNQSLMIEAPSAIPQDRASARNVCTEPSAALTSCADKSTAGQNTDFRKDACRPCFAVQTCTGDLNFHTELTDNEYPSDGRSKYCQSNCSSRLHAPICANTYAKLEPHEKHGQATDGAGREVVKKCCCMHAHEFRVVHQCLV
jgi:hypothetical protein